MAVNSVLVDTAVVVKYKVGVDTKGNEIFRNQRANDLNLLATEEILMDLGDIIGGFISYPISQVTKETVNLLSR
ncbi:DUF1659 domain-containing protein [Clostridium gasigenes]|uniref:DUF1659 domain-containing protein n=1 Tax=Clostridium gasigenes TaxID=94869 RepID=A0A1H0QN17_9CLOT|nr:DUF1659 domain-containing protein [Clostridium gasigenes]SDP18590.1 Protein of unknown function [Clostridium gasigenes]